MSDYLAGFERFAVEATDTMERDPETRQPPIHRTIQVFRPDRMRCDSKSALVDRSIWFNGQTVSLLDRKSNRYLAIDAPSLIDPMLDEMAARYGIGIPLADLLHHDPYQALVAGPGTSAVEYLGQVTVAEVECHHLAFEADTLRWEIWIEVGERPLPRKFVVSQPSGAGRQQYEVTLTHWDLAPQFQNERFEFRPPAGAEQNQPPLVSDSR